MWVEAEAGPAISRLSRLTTAYTTCRIHNKKVRIDLSLSHTQAGGILFAPHRHHANAIQAVTCKSLDVRVRQEYPSG